MNDVEARDGLVIVNVDDAMSADSARALAARIVSAAEEIERERITARTRAWYHGYEHNSGHTMLNIDGSSVRYDDRSCPVNHLAWIDGGWAPRTYGGRRFFVQGDEGLSESARKRLHGRGTECDQGQFLRHYLSARGVTMLAWWDRTQGDTRWGCNTVYIVEGDRSASDMLAWWPRHFPKQARCLVDAGISLIEVTVP